MRPLAGCIFLSAILVLVFAGAAGALITREEGANSIAGVLTGDGSDEYIFRVMAGQILFVDLDGSLYQARGPHEAHEETGDAPALAEAGGCPDGDGGCAEEGDGCTDDGGGGQFCLQVELNNEVICWAGRPAPPPGWSRDPRMACVFEESANDYILRVFRTSAEGDCSIAPDESLATMEGEANSWPYLLNFSLRDIAPEGRIEPAVGKSQSGF